MLYKLKWKHHKPKKESDRIVCHKVFLYGTWVASVNPVEDEYIFGGKSLLLDTRLHFDVVTQFMPSDFKDAEGDDFEYRRSADSVILEEMTTIEFEPDCITREEAQDRLIRNS